MSAEGSRNRSPYTRSVASDIGFAKYAPDNGFAAALRSGQREADLAQANGRKTTVGLTDKPTLSNSTPVDKENGFSVQTKRRQVVIEAVAGRRIDPSKRGSRWGAFQSELERRNGGLFVVADARKLMLPYLSSDLMGEMLKARFDVDAKSSGDTNKGIRRFMEKMNDFAERKHKADISREQRLLSDHPDLAQAFTERLNDPDNPKWLNISTAHPEFPVKRDADGLTVVDDDGFDQYDFSEWLPRESLSVWTNAKFEVTGQGSSQSSYVSVELADTSGVLSRGRDMYVDAMGDCGLDVTPVPAEWKPQIDIMRTIGGRSIDAVRMSIPPMPIDIPLQPPHIYQI